METPLVSILLPARDAEETITEALAGLRDQTLRDWECLVVDDASGDRTADLAARFARRDPRVRLFRSPCPEGIVGALGRAGAEARAPFLARQDADDRSRPARLERSLALIRSDPRLGAVATRVQFHPVRTASSGWRHYEDWLNALVTAEEIERDLWVESPLPHPAVLMRREAFVEAGGYREKAWPEDYDLWLRMHALGWRFAKVPEVLYDWRLHGRRLTVRDARYSAEAFLACKLHHLERRLSGRSIWIWGAGRDGRRLARALRDRGRGPELFLDIDPRKIGRTRLGCPVRQPEDALGPRRALQAHGAAPLLLVAVGTRGARALIRSRLEGLGWKEPEDYVCLH